jgi:sugar lactone lactonase YvrE
MLLRSFLRSVMGRSLGRGNRANPPQGRCNRSAGLRPRIEVLEDRLAPSGVSISVADATINELGSAGDFVTPGSGGLKNLRDLALGPDGNLYVSSRDTNNVIRYSAATGQLIGTFVAANSGGLINPYSLTFGPDGNLYVCSSGTDAVYRYNGVTGAFINAFVPTGSGGLDDPGGILFGQDGNLYVRSAQTDSVLRFQGPAGPLPGSPLPAPGQSGATFVPTGSGGLDEPQDMEFGPDGNLYVTSGGSGQAVLKFSSSTGAYLSTLNTGLSLHPRGLIFDQEGRLYLADIDDGSIHRYDASGNYLDDPVSGIGKNVLGPVDIIFDAQGALLISSSNTNSVKRYSSGVVVSLSAASPTPVTVDYATVDGSATNGDYSAQTGTVTFAPGQTSRRILLGTRDDVAVEATESFTVQLSNAMSGTTIADSSAVVNIVDDDAARQMTIADTSAAEGNHVAHYRGAFVSIQAGLNFNDLTFGPDGNIYASPGPFNNGINRYDGTTGAFIDEFVPAAPYMFYPRDIVFRAGYMYVGSAGTNEVLRFDATTGAFVDTFVTAGSGGITSTDGLHFGPDANGDSIPELYVTGGSNLVRFNGATGQPLGPIFNTSGSGALSAASGLTEGPGGVIYVASAGTNQVQKYNAVTGAYLGAVSHPFMSSPKGVRFGPDGLMYVTGGTRIQRFTASGIYVDDYVPAGSGGMVDGFRIEFGPEGDLYATSLRNEVGCNQILRFGTESEALFTVSISTPSSVPLTVDYATLNGSAIAGSDYTATSGTLTFGPGVTTQTIRVPILADSNIESIETFTVNLANATGSIITDSSGVGAIQDASKFYVVNDAASDRTFEYGGTGITIENYALNSGNTAPRGAASNAAGDRVWVVDANKTVYIYNPSGALLGSWAAGSLASNAQVEGVATNGTDIWLVDARQDKVFKYTGAASRLSGSQNAASSFNLSSSNSNAKGLVTDGTSIWVVDDSGADKVFKYTLAGGSLGNWTIGSANASPTGITLDPTAPGHLWIVDSGADRVYQYDGAVSRISGSQSPSTSFALAAGNTNPQDIADPVGFSISVTDTTTTLQANGTNPAAPAQTLAFTATVSGGGPANGDIVELHDATYDDALAATGVLDNGSVTLTVPANALAAGTHNLVAVYAGNASNAPSVSDPIAQIIDARPQIVSVTPNGNIPSLAGPQRSRVASLVVAFNRAVELDADAITLALHTNDVVVNGVPQPSGFGSLPTNLVLKTTDNLTWTVAFAGNTDDGQDGFNSLKDGVYDFNIDAAKVHPFGDPATSMAANSTTVIHRLFGDTGAAATPSGGTPGTDFQAVVNTGNNLAFRTAFNNPAKYAAFLDFNGDGVINFADNLQFRSRFNKALTWRA